MIFENEYIFIETARRVLSMQYVLKCIVLVQNIHCKCKYNIVTWWYFILHMSLALSIIYLLVQYSSTPSYF